MEDYNLKLEENRDSYTIKNQIPTPVVFLLYTVSLSLPGDCLGIHFDN